METTGTSGAATPVQFSGPRQENKKANNGADDGPASKYNQLPKVHTAPFYADHAERNTVVDHPRFYLKPR